MSGWPGDVCVQAHVPGWPGDVRGYASSQWPGQRAWATFAGGGRAMVAVPITRGRSGTRARSTGSVGRQTTARIASTSGNAGKSATSSRSRAPRRPHRTAAMKRFLKYQHHVDAIVRPLTHWQTRHDHPHHRRNAGRCARALPRHVNASRHDPVQPFPGDGAQRGTAYAARTDFQRPHPHPDRSRAQRVPG